MTVAIIGVRCHSCSRYYPEGDTILIGESVRRCLKCQEKHYDALEVLAGHPPKACGECGATWDELKRRDGKDDVAMYIHEKDGCYQALCEPCSDAYVRKRRDLYGGTRFGARMGL